MRYGYETQTCVQIAVLDCVELNSAIVGRLSGAILHFLLLAVAVNLDISVDGIAVEGEGGAATGDIVYAVEHRVWVGVTHVFQC